MINNINILGNDDRMDYVASYLYSVGYEVSRDIMCGKKDSITIIQPPLTNERWASIKPFLVNEQYVFAGSISREILEESASMGIKLIDYLKWEKVVVANGILTAEGIIKQAILNKAVLEESNCLVTGYGYCGKALVDALKNVNAKVDVAVRNKKLKDEIEAHDCQYVDITAFEADDTSKYSYIFNTVPAMVITQEVIDGFSQNVMIFDIASKPGGVDFDYCLSKDIFFLHSLGIPGKEYPKEAGEIIAKAVVEYINSKQPS